MLVMRYFKMLPEGNVRPNYCKIHLKFIDFTLKGQRSNSLLYYAFIFTQFDW